MISNLSLIKYAMNNSKELTKCHVFVDSFIKLNASTFKSTFHYSAK